MHNPQYKSTCVFCSLPYILPHKILAQGTTWYIIENDAPRAPVSLLVIPKIHFESILDPGAEKCYSSLFAAARKYIYKNKKDFKAGFRLVINYGKDARQSLPHMHLHILAGSTKGYDLGRYCTAKYYPEGTARTH